MTEQPDVPDQSAPASPTDEPLPWETDPPPEEERGADGRRLRHDAFTARRKHDFLKALVKTGCLEDACRLTGVSSRTVYRHQEEDAAFLGHCTLALRMVETPIELTAWQRAVEGVEQEFACGGQVHVRRRYDGGLLRLLLQASNPKKYGPRPGFKRKRLLKHERKQIEREIRARLEAEATDRSKGLPDKSFEQAVESVLAKIEAIERHEEPAKRAAGWTTSPEGHWIPPGYGPIPGWTPPPAAARDGEDPRACV